MDIFEIAFYPVFWYEISLLIRVFVKDIHAVLVLFKPKEIQP